MPALLFIILDYAGQNVNSLPLRILMKILWVEGLCVGQALRKLENYYGKVESRSGLSGKVYRDSMEYWNFSIEKSHIYNNLDNDDYDYKRVLITKSNVIKMYLARNLDRNKIENIEEVENLTIRLVEKVENKYLSVEEAAKYLDCTTKTIRNRIKAGMPYETDKNKYMISIENLEKWRHGKPDGVEIPSIEEVEELKQDIETEVEIVDNSNEVEYVPSVVENFVTRDELNSYTSAIKDFTIALSDIRQESRHELDKQREYFEKLLAQQQELTVSMFEELKREKDMEKKEVLSAIENVKNDSFSNTESIIKEYEWIKKQNEDILAAQSKRPWWKFWKK